MEDPKDFTRKPLKMINDFYQDTNLSGYKYFYQDTKLIYRNLLHFYTQRAKQQKEKLREKTPSTITPKIIKYLGINLTKEVKDLYSANYKTLKEMEDDTNKWSDFPCLWIGRVTIVKMSILKAKMSIN